MNISPRDPDNTTPLTPQAFYILLALAQYQNSGYGLIKAVAEDTNGAIQLRAGTIYPLLDRLTRLGYIGALEPKSGSGPHGVVKIYRISPAGLAVLGWEVDRYAAGAKLGQSRLTAHHVQWV